MANPLYKPTLLQRRQEFERRHPEVIIISPLDTLSGLWEVSMPGESVMAFDNGSRMMAALEQMYETDEES